MSGFITKPPSSNSLVYNPGFYTASTDYLTLETADLTYCKLYDPRLTYTTSITAGTAAASKALVLDSSRNITNINSIATTSLVLNGTTVSSSDLALLSGITAGTASASKALVVDSSRNISNINSISTTSLTVNGSAISSSDLALLSGITAGTCTASKALVVDSSRNITNINSISTTSLTVNGTPFTSSVTMPTNWSLDASQLSWTNASTGATGAGTSYWLGNNISYNDYALTLFNYYTPGKKWGVRMNMTEASGLYYGIHSQSSGMYFTTRSNTASTNCDIAIFNNVGCVGIGRNTNLSSNHRLEVNGSLMISDTANTYALANLPQLGIINSAQASANRSDFFTFGKYISGSDYGSWTFSSYYQSVTQDTANYMSLCPTGKTSTSTGVGIVMNKNGQCSFQDSNANSGTGGLVVGGSIQACVDIYGGVSRFISANGALRSNATPAVYNAGGGTTRIGLYVQNAIWCADVVYASSDERLKRDIEPIQLSEAKKVLDVQAVKYRWKDKTDDFDPQVGCIAQNLIEAGLESLVSYVPNDKMPMGYSYGVAYDRLAVYLLELVKDQEKRLKGLELKDEKS